MALSQTFDKPRFYATAPGPEPADYVMKASTTIYDGQVLATDVANHAGLALPFDVAGTWTTPLFLGFADGRATSAATGTTRIRARTRGKVILTAITGADGIDDVTKAVYATNDDTFTVTAATNVLIGKIVDYVAGEGFHVWFEAASVT
jgi:hypothetical protein